MVFTCEKPSRNFITFLFFFPFPSFSLSFILSCPCNRRRRERNRNRQTYSEDKDEDDEDDEDGEEDPDEDGHAVVLALLDEAVDLAARGGEARVGAPDLVVEVLEHLPVRGELGAHRLAHVAEHRDGASERVELRVLPREDLQLRRVLSRDELAVLLFNRLVQLRVPPVRPRSPCSPAFLLFVFVILFCREGVGWLGRVDEKTL